MALSADDYVAPAGDLEIQILWPRLDGESDDDRDDRAKEDIEAYRIQAYTKTSDDDLSRLWVNYRAWQRYADILYAIPSSASTDEGSRAYSMEQAAYWQAKATDALDEFNEEVETEAGDFEAITSYR